MSRQLRHRGTQWVVACLRLSSCRGWHCAAAASPKSRGGRDRCWRKVWRSTSLLVLLCCFAIACCSAVCLARRMEMYYVPCVNAACYSRARQWTSRKGAVPNASSAPTDTPALWLWRPAVAQKKALDRNHSTVMIERITANSSDKDAGWHPVLCSVRQVQRGRDELTVAVLL